MTCCSSSVRVLPNGYLEAANSAGNTSITPQRPNQAVLLTVTGDAGTRKIILKRIQRRAGDIVSFSVVLPAVADVNLDFRNDSEDGTQLLTSDRYPDNLFISDGTTLSASFRFVYTGSAWRYLDGTSPA